AALSIDSVAPALDAHDDVAAEAASAAGANVSYDGPTATDATSGAGAVTCSPASGSLFALGNTTVTCDVSDAAGNAASSNFTVRVVDATPPTIDAHANESAEATSAS